MLFNSKKYEGQVIVKNEPFLYKIFTSPAKLPVSEQMEIIELFGKNRNPGETKYSLGITSEYISTAVSTSQFDCFILVENSSNRDKYIDRGVAAFDYRQICDSDPSKRILVSNVCRVTRNAFFAQETQVTPKPKISPMYALFDIIRLLAIEKRIFSIYLRVDIHNNAHRVNKDSHEALTTTVYPKYGFAIDPLCVAVGYTTMRSDFTTTLHIRSTSTGTSTGKGTSTRRSKTIKRKNRV
jgi:hypothetical protein